MDFLKILDQKINLRNIKKLSNNIRRFHMTKCKNVLLNCWLEITLRIEKISVKPTNLCQQRFLTILIFSESISFIIERTFKKSLNLKGVILFGESKYQSLIFLIADNQIDWLISSQYGLDLAIGLEEGDILVEYIQDLYEVLVCALLVSLVSLLETHND